MRRLLDRFKADVGGDPLQILVLLACFALAGYAFYRASFGPLPVRMLVWFVAAILVHDLLLYPLYALADRSWLLVSRRVRPRVRAREHAVPVVNYVRVPALLSGLFLLVFWGIISGQGNGHFQYASGHGYVDYLARWLITVGVLFGLSALLYALALARHRGDPQPAEARPPARPDRVRAETSGAVPREAPESPA